MVGIPSSGIGKTECHVILFQDLENMLVDPGGMTNFKDMAVRGVKVLAELSKEISVESKTGWKLKENGSNLFFQAFHGIVESFQGFFGIFETFGVGNIFISLDGPEKFLWGSFMPILEGLGLRESIESGIDFQRIKVIRVEFKPF